jgi:hypothetical protein
MQRANCAVLFLGADRCEAGMANVAATRDKRSRSENRDVCHTQIVTSVTLFAPALLDDERGGENP